MDDADRADIQQQRLLDAQIAFTVNEKLVISNESGICWNCGEHIGTERRWCDANCRDDWDR
jgi:RNA polymerase-binding transcription factor DksA